MDNFTSPSSGERAMQSKMPIRPAALLSFIFFFSGFSALIYQVVWQRLLTVHYGVGPVSITLIVSLYMVGLGLGALFGGYLAERSGNKVALYFVIELLIGIFGLISLPLLAFIGQHTAGSSYVWSLFYMFSFLSVPTFLMGITLPLLTKIFNSLIRDFLKSVSFLYFINTLGAAIGTLFASYVLVSFFGLDIAAAVAVFINFVLAGLIFLLRNRVDSEGLTETVTEANIDRNAVFGKIAYVLVFITGFLAIGYEVIWFRVIGVLTKASPYAFSTVLFVYLLGIAIGSYAMSSYLKRNPGVHKKSLFFRIQFLIGVSVLVTFLGFFYLTEYTAFNTLTRVSFETDLHPSFGIFSPASILDFLVNLYLLLDIFWWSAFFMFVPATLMGASFPLISLLALTRHDDDGKTVGTVYFFNVAGNVFGGFVTGFLLLPYLGTEGSLLLFVFIGVGFVLFVSDFGGKAVSLSKKAGLAVFLLVVAVALFPRQGDLYTAIHPAPENTITFFEEGVEGVIVTNQEGEKIRNWIDGLGHGGRPFYHFYFQALEALTYSASPEKILLIGFGTGSSAELIGKSSAVKQLTLVELNESLLVNLQKIPLFEDILNSPKLDIIIDDGRRFLLRTDEKFDLVAMDPLRSTTAYSNNIYSQQFFELIHDHLSDNGVLMLYIDEHDVIPNTINSVFDYVRVYGSFVLASNAPFERHPEIREEVLQQFPSEDRRKILESDRGTYVGDETYIARELGHYPINQDWKPVAEYYIGLNAYKYFSSGD